MASSGEPLATAYDREFYARRHAKTVDSARAMISALVPLLGGRPPRSVIDVGCGLGTFLAVFREFGVQDLCGVEGEWVDPAQLQIPREQFRAQDLTRPWEPGRAFDLAVSLEVGEHLPVESAPAFVEALTRCAPVVLFSAAIPGQGGSHHVNEQWPDYWAERFARRNYAVADVLRRRLWTRPDVLYWYKQNALVFVDEARFADFPLLAEEARRTAGEPLSYVHPDALAVQVERTEAAARPTIGMAVSYLQGAVERSLRKRLLGPKGSA